jgi:hypothetical protein
LWGNNFFVPWRRNSIDQVTDEELRTLYAEGFWNNNMEGSRSLDMNEVRQARGVKLSKGQREKIELACEGRGPWCTEAYTLFDIV